MPDLSILHDCATIQLTQDFNTIVDLQDYPELSRYRWCVLNLKYAIHHPARTNGRLPAILMHRMILESMVGTIPNGMYTDHISGDGLDNRRSNLRLVTPSENRVNSRRRDSLKIAITRRR